MDECYGINMDLIRDRCVLLQKDPCAEQVAYPALLGANYRVSLLLKRIDHARRAAAEELEAERRLTHSLSLPLDIGSHRTRLRFPDVKQHAGRHKVCFCDSTTGPCESPKDFGVDLGFLHVSGVECLVGDARVGDESC